MSPDAAIEALAAALAEAIVGYRSGDRRPAPPPGPGTTSDDRVIDGIATACLDQWAAGSDHPVT